MASTKKVIVTTASLIAVQCLLAGASYAASLAEGVPGVLSEALAAVTTLVVLQTALLVAIARIAWKFWKAQQEVRDTPPDPFNAKFGELIEKDTDLKALLTQILTKMNRQDESLKPIFEDWARREAEKKADDLPAL
ncbi:MAG: hypothetical protein ACR2RF_25415 [Geminicoccaceae bacterium]